jgi:hypothetical protein
MHQTTLRFGKDLWDALELEAQAVGVSVAQFIREAAVARLGYAAARRGDPDWARTMGALEAPADGELDAVAEARARADEEIRDASAHGVQSLQAKRRANAVRDARDASESTSDE